MFTSKSLFFLSLSFTLFSASHGSPLRYWRRYRSNFAERVALCFFGGYFGASSICDIDRALTFWDERAKVYAADGSVFDKTGLVGGLKLSCTSLDQMKFSQMSLRRVDRRSFVTTQQISQPARHSATFNFSDAFTFRFFLDKNYQPCAHAVSLTTSIDPPTVLRMFKK